MSIYAVVFGRLPFKNNDEIKTKEPDYELPVASVCEGDKSDRISDELRQCLQGLLSKEPEARPTISEAIDRFTWLQL